MIIDSVLRIAVAALVIIGVGEGSKAFSRRRVMNRLRREHERRFDRSVELPKLDELVVRVRNALPHLDGSPLRISIPDAADESWLELAVKTGAARFDIDPLCLTWRFGRELAAPNAAGCVWWTHRESMRRSGNDYVVRSNPDRPVQWNIEVADRYREDPETALAIVGHELAHVALFSRGIALTSSADNERLTDVTAALAGFGFVMFAASQREEWYEANGTMFFKPGGSGYLHPRAIEYLYRTYVVQT